MSGDTSGLFGDRRNPGKFRELLSMTMVLIAALGGFLVLLDPRFSLQNTGSWAFVLGSGEFSKELKGAVVTIMLIGGWQAVQGFWLGASAGGQKTAESMSRIAEASAPAVAAAAAPKAEIRADDVKVQAAGNVTVETNPSK